MNGGVGRIVAPRNCQVDGPGLIPCRVVRERDKASERLLTREGAAFRHDMQLTELHLALRYVGK